ncbi:hypothetical protein ABTN29_19810, partial [Acinetobacter baumannii]
MTKPVTRRWLAQARAAHLTPLPALPVPGRVLPPEVVETLAHLADQAERPNSRLALDKDLAYWAAWAGLQGLAIA